MRLRILILLLLTPFYSDAVTVSEMSLTKSAAPFTGLMAGDTVHFCLDVASPAPLADIVWVIDVSNSMQAGINNIIANINIFTANLSSRGLNYRQGLFIYTGDTFDWYYNWFGWAPTDAQFSTDLNDSLTYIYGGIEWSLEALQFADGMVGWRPGASRTMILITDEGLPCAETGYQYPMDASVGGPWAATETITGTAAILAADGVTVDSISKPWPWDTDPEHRCDPQDLPPASGGLWLDYSTPPAGWNTMLNQIASAIQGQATLSVRDPVPPQVVPIAGTWCCGGTLVGNELSWTVSGYASGQLLQFCFDGLVTSPWAWGSTIINTGYAGSDAIPEFASNPWPLIYATPTVTVTPTDSPTCTDTPTDTSTRSPTQTASPTSTATPSASPTPTLSPTLTCTPTSTLTSSPTPTYSASPTPTSTITWTHTGTGTPSITPTYTSTFTASPSSTITMTPAPHIYVQLSVFNSAGELVKNLPQLTLSSPPTSMSTGEAVFDPDQGQTVQIHFPGHQQVASWDGTNANGQLVGGGVYILQAAYTDNFSRTVTMTAAVQVIRAPTVATLEIYNSAGEVVRRILTQVGLTKPVPPELSTAILVLSPQSGGSSSGLKVGLGGQSAWWDGRNDAGVVVSPGAYLVKVTWQAGGQTVETDTRAVTVLAPQVDDPLATAWMAPNPVPASLGSMVIGLDPGVSAAGLRGQIYNLAGELVVKLAPDATGRMVWMFGNRVSAGVYLIRLQMVDAAGRLRTRMLKAALLP